MGCRARALLGELKADPAYGIGERLDHGAAKPAMPATFLIAGNGIPPRRALGLIDMRDIAPTLAYQLGVSLPQPGSALLVASP